MADKTNKDSSKQIVKILVIIGIGIPVLIELMTLFNLINVQIFEEEKATDVNEAYVTDVDGLGEGDSLFTETDAPLIIDKLRVEVDAQQWLFELGLRSLDSLHRYEELQIRLDSLKLQSNKTLIGDDSSLWAIKNERPVTIHAEWELPNGDIPTTLYLSMLQRTASDSMIRIQQKVPLHKIPVRYNEH